MILPEDSRVSQKAYIVGIVLCCLLALALQAVAFRAGFVATSADESARALIARDLSWDNVFVPQIWPPFYEVAVGLALKLNPDLVYGPRMLSTAFGLMTLVALAVLARDMFGSRRVALVTAVLAVVLHHRLLLSVAPMAEIFFNFFVIAAAVGMVRFVRDRSAKAFLFAAAMLFLAGTVRFEGWFLCVAFAAAALVVQWRARPIGWGVIWAGIAVAGAFPAIWIGLSLYHFGDLSGITAASDQNHSANIALTRIAWNSHAMRFLRDTLDGPLLPGVIAAIYCAWRYPAVRLALGVSFAGMLLATAAAVATASSPLATPWRIAGAWTSLMVPFTALALAWLADRMGTRFRGAVLGALVLAVAGLMALSTARLAAQTIRTPKLFSTELLDLRAAVADRIDPDGGRVLIDVVDVHFLDLVTAIDRPEAMVYSTGTDPIGIALYIGQRDFWKSADTDEGREIYERYISLKTDFADDPALLDALGIGLVLIQDDAARARADTLPWLEPLGQYGNWQLYGRR